ncbi:MAG: fasciclin domain-containing protein, partial [Bacteroidota bacterium]
VVDDTQLSTLEAAVIEAGLDDDLGSDGPFTVFAPTDAAFQSLLEDLDATADDLLARDDLADILRLHVVVGRTLEAGDLDPGDQITTLNGETLTVVATAGGSGLGLDTEDPDTEANATIVDTDIEASNGIVHKIGTVLLPDGD